MKILLENDWSRTDISIPIQDVLDKMKGDIFITVADKDRTFRCTWNEQERIARWTELVGTK